MSQTPIVKDLESVFILIFKTGSPLPPSEKQLCYDSYTKELVVADLFNRTAKKSNFSDSDENELKKKIIDNDIFSTKRTYYTNKMDQGSRRILIILDGKFHTVDIDVYDPKVTDSDIPKGLSNLLQILDNMIPSK